MGMFGAMGSAMGMGMGGGNAGPMQKRPGMPMQGQNPGGMAGVMARTAQMRNPNNPGLGQGVAPSQGMMNKMMPGQMGGMQKPAPMMGAPMGGGMERMPQVRDNYAPQLNQPMPMQPGMEAPEEVPGAEEQMNPMNNLMSQYGRGPMQGGGTPIGNRFPGAMNFRR